MNSFSFGKEYVTNYGFQIILKDLYLPKENTICLLSRENDFAE